jgi:fatty acid-binding protein DegV
MKDLMSKMKTTADIDTWNYVFISHGDCEEDAENVKAMVEEAYPQAKVILSDVGPVIGAHTGPGVIALCYLGKTEKGTM